MNDPGLNGPIEEGIAKYDSGDKEAQEEEGYSLPAQWWFASTACPLLAGTFGPMASTFSILALATYWRMMLVDALDDNGVAVPDPAWLIAVNAVSLFLALISNMALLLNMAGRVRFAVAQPIIIVGWYLASVMLIVLVAVASTALRQGHTMTQGYYYAIMAAVLYFLIASLMAFTVYGAYKKHYPKDFKLTTSQRTLMLQTIVFLVYLVSWAAIYMRIEGWKFLDAVYWGLVTVLTIGIGDFHPTTHLGRSLLFPYAIFGILIVGILIGSIRSLVLERGKEKVYLRIIERERESAVQGRRQYFFFEFVPILRRYKRTSPRHPLDHTASSGEKERAEFELMRAIHKSAHQTRRWTALAYSSLTWFTLWLGGAFIFWKGEEGGQGWTYFDGIYFSLTSLITLGYGDYYIQSESSKAFFVLWALLAIPTVTILISNLGETLIRGIEISVLKIGDWTILPNTDRGMKAAVRDKVVKAITHQKFLAPGMLGFSSREREMDEASGVEEVGDTETTDADLTQDAERHGETVVDSGRATLEETSQDPDTRLYTMAKEMRKLVRILRESPAHQFSFEKWTSLLHLTGHKVAALQQSLDEAKKQDSRGTETTDGGAAAAAGQHGQFSWMGERSPLMDTLGESEWLLERLAVALEHELATRCSVRETKHLKAD